MFIIKKIRIGAEKKKGIMPGPLPPTIVTLRIGNHYIL